MLTWSFRTTTQFSTHSYKLFVRQLTHVALVGIFNNPVNTTVGLRIYKEALSTYVHWILQVIELWRALGAVIKVNASNKTCPLEQ